MGVTWGFEHTLALAAVAVDVALAAWLVVLNRHSAVNVGLAAFILTTAATSLLGTVGNVAIQAGNLRLAAEVAYWQFVVIVASAAAGIHFALVFPRPRRLARWQGTRLALAALPLATLAALVVEPTWYVTLTGRGGALEAVRWGPLAVLRLVPTTTLILAAATVGYLRAGEGPDRRSLHIVMTAALCVLLAGNLHRALVRLLPFVGLAPHPLGTDLWSVTMGYFRTLPAVLVDIGVVVALAVVAYRDASRRRECLATLRWVAAFTPLPLGLVLLRIIAGPDAFAAWSVGVSSILSIVLACATAYAIVRHQLFGIEVKLRWTVRASTIAGVFLAVFFVVTSVAEAYLQSFGVLIGGAVAGLLLFALAPLQRFAERVATSAVPNAREASTIPMQERAAIYREQARLAWADGALERSERVLLDGLRDRLGVPPEVAARIESEAATSWERPPAQPVGNAGHQEG